MIKTFILGMALAGVVGGPYIMLLAFFRPRTFNKQNLAKWQGLAAFLVGAAILITYYFKVWH